jgi:hypothetical protein
MLDAVGQPEDEMLDGHGAVRAPTHLYRRLENGRLLVVLVSNVTAYGLTVTAGRISLGTFLAWGIEKVGQE